MFWKINIGFNIDSIFFGIEKSETDDLKRTMSLGFGIVNEW